MNFEEEYGAESISRTEGDNSNNQEGDNNNNQEGDNNNNQEGDNSNNQEELFFKFKDLKGDEKEISGKLNDSFTSLIDKYKQTLEIKGNVYIVISINGKVVKTENKTVNDILKEYYPTLSVPYTQDIMDNEKVAFHAVLRFRGGKHHN